MLRHIRDFFGVTFKLDDYRPDDIVDSDEDESGDEQENNNKSKLVGAKKLVLTCVGTGFVNFSKGNI